MATMWRHSNEGFVPSPAFPLSVISPDESESSLPLGSGVRVVAFRDGTRPGHALIADSAIAVQVNGLHVVGGIRVLQHKDELIVGSEQMFFSAESAPVVEEYLHDSSRRRPRCPTCRGEIMDGQPIVRCPGCSRIYHQIDATDESPEKPCWTYSPTCRFCQHPSSMSGEPTWRPDDEQA